MLGLHQSEDFKITLYFVKPAYLEFHAGSTIIFTLAENRSERIILLFQKASLGATWCGLGQMSQSSSEIEEKIRIARELKDEGNALVKEKEYRNAIKKYVKVSGMNIGVLLIYVVLVDLSLYKRIISP